MPLLANRLFNVMRAKLSSKVTTVPNIMAIHMNIEDIQAKCHAVKLLQSGGVIAVPTDTIYGLACDATNVDAIDKLYSIKCRNENKPLAICLGEVHDVKHWAIVKHLPVGLLSKLLPGPVTLILESSNRSLDKSLIHHGKVGIRIPNYDFIRTLSSGLGTPLALTSANLSSKPSSVSIEEFHSLWEKLDCIFNGGNLSDNDINRSGSTIVDLSKRGFYTIVRNGIALEHTCLILKQFGLRSST